MSKAHVFLPGTAGGCNVIEQTAIFSSALLAPLGKMLSPAQGQETLLTIRNKACHLRQPDYWIAVVKRQSKFFLHPPGPEFTYVNSLYPLNFTQYYSKGWLSNSVFPPAWSSPSKINEITREQNKALQKKAKTLEKIGTALLSWARRQKYRTSCILSNDKLIQMGFG